MSLRITSDPTAFSLRQVVTEEAASKPVFLSMATQAPTQLASAAVAAKPGPGLKFDFTSLRLADKPSSLPIGRSVSNIQDLQASNLRNPFEQPRDAGNKADVMRLTAMVDDLQTRLKTSSDRAHAVEIQLTRTHQCLLSERQNAASYAKTMNAEISSARLAESTLRTELANTKDVVMHSVSNDKFEAAVSATLAADAVSEKTRKELSALKIQHIELKRNTSIIEQEISSLRESKSTADVECTSAVDERDRANQQHAQMSKELETTRSQLEEARTRTADVESQLLDLQSAHDANVAQVQLAKIAPIKCDMETNNDIKENARLSGELETTRSQLEEARTRTADLESQLLGLQSAHDANVAQVQLAKITSTKCDMETNNECHEKTDARAVGCNRVANPIKMYTKYHTIRNKLADIEIQMKKSDPQYVHRLEDMRDDLYVEARLLKAKYDMIFGTDHGHGQEEKCEVEREGEKENKPAVVGAIMEDKRSFEIFGDEPPDYRVPFGTSMAHQMSTMCPLGGAAPEGHRDVAIGSCTISPFSVSAEVDQTSPTGDDDSASDMVNAVIADLTHFLKDVKARSVTVM
jgi:hypothetical protein